MAVQKLYDACKVSFTRNGGSFSAQGLLRARMVREQSVQVEANLPSKSDCSKVKPNDVRRFLEEQRGTLIELQDHLKDHRTLLHSIYEELALSKSESKIVNAARASSHTPVESVNQAASVTCERGTGEVQSANAAICGSSLVNGSERTTKDCEPDVLSDKVSESDASASKKGLDTDKFQHPPWPVWKSFLDCLRPYVPVKDGKLEAGNEESFDDTALLKHVIVKFAQAHEAAFRGLWRQDLAMLVQHDFPSMDKKTTTGKQKLQNYLAADESEVSRAKLTDVVRLIYRAVRSLPLLGYLLPDDLQTSIIRILQKLISESIAKHDNLIKENDQKLAEEGEMGRLNNMSNMVDGVAVSMSTSPSTNQDETSLELPKFSSLKERVDARRARLAKERVEKEAAKSSTKEPQQETPKPCYAQINKSREDPEVIRNFGAFDAIIESEEDSDSCESSNSQPNGVSKASLSSLVRKNWSTPASQSKGVQNRNGEQRNNGGRRAR